MAATNCTASFKASIRYTIPFSGGWWRYYSCMVRSYSIDCELSNPLAARNVVRQEMRIENAFDIANALLEDEVRERAATGAIK
jgi:hypothetical protein